MDWSVFPEGHEYVQADESSFRGFIVEFYNIISDVVVQDGYQSVLNLRTTLDLLSRRHTRFKRCSRETDGAGSYNSIFVALMTLQLGTGQDITHPHTHTHVHTHHMHLQAAKMETSKSSHITTMSLATERTYAILLVLTASENV